MHSPICYLCNDCLKALQNNKVPTYNSKNVDYGRPLALGLKEPSFATIAAMSLIRVCGATIKIKDGVVKNSVVKLSGHVISFPHAAVGISSETILRPLSVLQTNANDSTLEGPVDVTHRFDGFLSCPNIFPQPGHVKAEVMLYFVGPKNTVDQLIVLGATNRIKPCILNVSETYDWLKCLKAVNVHYKNITIDESIQMINSMNLVREELINPELALRIETPLDVHIDRVLDSSSLDFEGTTFRPHRNPDNVEVSSNTIPLATENFNDGNASLQADRLADSDEVHSSTTPLATEDVHEENTALQPDIHSNNDEENSSTIPLAIEIPLATENLSLENTEVRAPITVSPILQQYRIDEDFNDFSSYAVMREGGVLLSGTEQSHTAAILTAISKVLPLYSARSENPVNEYESFAKLLYGAFPYLFVTGTGLPTTGGISQEHVRHMLLQGCGRFGKCFNFIFTLQNHSMRKKASLGASLQIKRHPEQMQQFADFINDPESPQNIIDGLEDPSKNDSQVIPLILFGAF